MWTTSGAFGKVRSEDIAAHWEYRTKSVILGIFDARQATIDTGAKCQKILGPSPCRGPRHPESSRVR